MTTATDVAERAQERTGSSAARNLVLLSGLFLALQVSATDYGREDEGGAAVFWFAVGAVLLWLVHRKRSGGARALVVALSVLGAVLYVGSAFGDGRAALVCAAYVGQAVTLLLPPVRRHVTERQG